MKIAVNCRLLQENKLDGIGVFMHETLKKICRAHPEHEFIFIFDRKFYSPFIYSGNVKPVVLGPAARHPLQFIWWLEFSVKEFLDKEKPDLFLSPDGYLSLRSKLPALPVIHDLNFEHGSFGMPWYIRLYYRFFFPRFAKKAVRIATVSTHSANDINSFYSIPKEKIDVVYNGASSGFQPVNADMAGRVRSVWTADKPYFLFAGSIHERKNISRLLKAFDLFKKTDESGMKLVLAGQKQWWTREMQTVMRKMNYSHDVIFTGRLPQRSLEKLMAASHALVYVPLFEGFGIPVLEAMACDVPVISSNTSSLPEVCGEAALLCDPYDENDIASKMSLLCNDDPIRAKLIEAGRTQVLNFTWERSAELLWNSIERALRN